MVKKPVALDGDTYRRLKLHAAETDQTHQAILEAALANYLKRADAGLCVYVNKELLLRFSFKEIRTHAASFARNYADATYEKGETQTFYNDFFAIFGVERGSVACYEEHVRKLNNKSGFIDLCWPRVLLVEQKSAGRDLTKAATHAGGYFDALKETERPRFQLLCDFQTFELLDRDRREILNAEWFVTTKQAQTAINAWLKQYNNIRPHQALNMRPPVPETLLKNGT